MRLAPCFLLTAAAAAVEASSGLLYIYNDRVSAGDKQPTTLKADAARLVIASRLGLDQYHSLQGQSESALQDIDRLSGQSSFLSSNDASVAFILSTSDDDLPFSFSQSADVETIQIKDSPDFKTAEQLLKDLAQQSGVDNLHDVQHSTVSSEAGPAFRIAQDSRVLAHLIYPYAVLPLTVIGTW